MFTKQVNDFISIVRTSDLISDYEPEQFPITLDQHQYVLRLCERFGIPYSLRKSDYTWDGTRIYFGNCDTFSSYCHEIAHYLVIPTDYRHMINYGLGGGPTDRSNEDIPLRDYGHPGITDIIIHNEDIIAGLLGCYFEYIYDGNLSNLVEIGRDGELNDRDIKWFTQVLLEVIDN